MRARYSSYEQKEKLELADDSPNFEQKKPAQVMRGLESTEVVEETDFTIHDLLRRTKRPARECLQYRTITLWSYND